jgi:septum formation protein
MTASLLLASQSPARQRLLRDAGVVFDVVKAFVDEDAVKEALVMERATPMQIADTLAEMKALKGSQKSPDAFVIGADQVLAFQGKVLSKPASLAEARSQLLSLKGQSHELITASVLAKNGAAIWRHTARARLKMRDFSDQFLDDYLAQMGDRVTQTVGAYEIEGLGVQLFDSIDGDIFSIQGLPLLPLLDILRQHGMVQS